MGQVVNGRGFYGHNNYKVFLTLSHQNLGQIDKKLLESILTNTSCQLVFRVSRKDAEILAKEIFKVDPKEIQQQREYHPQF